MSQYVLSWSKRQNALHVESLEVMLSSNRQAYRDERACDYLPIHIGTQDECLAAADAIRPTMAARDLTRVRVTL
jgi:hypothetical protein